MYQDFANWLTDLEAFKLGITFGCVFSVFIFFIIQAIVEYAIDLFNKKCKKDEK